MKRIYPLSPYKTATWRNWGSYAYWLDNEILSLQQYLQMFNANYKILNDSVKYINSNTWSEPESEENTIINEDVWKQLSIEGLDEEYMLYQLFDSEEIKSKVIYEGEQIWTNIVHMSEKQITSGDIQGSIKSLIDMELNPPDVPKTID